MRLAPYDIAPPKGVEELVSQIKNEISDVRVSIEQGGETAGNWWIDVNSNGGTLALEWHPEKGIRIYPADGGYGDGPVAIFHDALMAVRRVAQVMKTGSATPIEP